MTRRKGKWTGRGSLSLKYDRGWFESKSDVILFFFGKDEAPSDGWERRVGMWAPFADRRRIYKYSLILTPAL